MTIEGNSIIFDRDNRYVQMGKSRSVIEKPCSIDSEDVKLVTRLADFDPSTLSIIDNL